ncbi:hypothetical protein AAY473_040349 [Plecturocebus cupreus]
MCSQDPQDRLACPCLPAAAGPTACVRSCGGFRPWNPPWGGAGGERLWLSLWLLHGHWQVAAAVPFWASVVCPPSCSVPGEERAICRMLEGGACGATAHLNALGGSDGGCRVPGAAPCREEERAICRMLEAGACGATAHLNALGGSDGGCRVPGSCYVPGEERAICRMLEGGACGTTAHLNALGGSDGGCRVPGSSQSAGPQFFALCDHRNRAEQPLPPSFSWGFTASIKATVASLPSSAPLAAACTSMVTTSVDLRHLQGAAPSDPLALCGSCLSRRHEGHTADGSLSLGPSSLASAQSDVPQSLGDVQPDPQERLACPCLPAAAGPTACVRSCGGFWPWNRPWGGAGGERLWLSLWLLHGHWQVAVAVPFWASVVCPPSCSVPGEERAICRMLEGGACGATAHLNALGGSDGGCRVRGVPFWASVVCLPSCSMPGEERAICRMLEAGACGATAHLNALGGSDGGCRVPGVPFWVSVVCPPSCSVPGEERAICRMLEAGACGATAHLNALGGSDGGCRVPGR